jgi:uncharacterized membrane protein YidH (DUF202 family)
MSQQAFRAALLSSASTLAMHAAARRINQAELRATLAWLRGVLAMMSDRRAA